MLSASPPWMRPRLTDGRSNSSEDSRENGRDSIRRKTSIAFRTALSPSHGVEPCAERPWTWRRKASTPLAWTPTCRSVGSPVIAKSPPKPPRTTSSIERVSMSSDSSSGTQTKRTRTVVLLGEVAQRAHHRGEAALHVVGAAAVEPVALDPRRELLRVAGHDVEVPVEDERRRRRAARRRRSAPEAPPKTLSWTSISRASSQPLMKPGARADPVRLDVSYVISRSASARSSTDRG